MSLRKPSGFTLIEMMIVVAIMGIMAAIAIPSYQEYVFRGNRTEGIALLNDAAARQERYYAQNNKYAVSVNDLGIQASSKNGLYALNVSTASVNTYTLVSEAKGAQLKDVKCGNLALDQAGNRFQKWNTQEKKGTSATGDCWK
ncbi:type IV pilin protein [Stutzerimonas stutzeri]|uniref:type IV pilin protein n=1 Tax=Stutzerimonas stutzeri TaxID=316 RepID=UPI000650A3B9|nr:type IV pilin protein [Stutzerimonas stutzeri]